MITITNEGTVLQVRVSIPPELNGGKLQYYTCTHDLGGSDCAVTAFANELIEKMSATIVKIRKDAYHQGVRDRARRARVFSGSLRTDILRAGCYA